MEQCERQKKHNQTCVLVVILFVFNKTHLCSEGITVLQK